jgi:ABC-type lipoprotein export system ATPase subunit
MKQGSSMLEFESVSKSFAGPRGQVCAMRDVSFSLKPGELLAIQGPSGCGKSTLLLAAGTLLTPDAGIVRVEGRNPYALGSEARNVFRSVSIGFVFQQFHLVPYLTVRQNILTPSIAMDRGDARERAEELIELFHLGHRVDHVSRQLSTGEQQRTALARALLNRPKLVLADEPTGNLDRENGDIVLNHLSAFTAAGGAVLLVTHDDRAVAHATRTLTMTDGVLA